MKTPTIQDVERMTKDAALRTAVSAYIKAVAYCDTVRDVIEPEKIEILNFFQFQIASEWVERGHPAGVVTLKTSYLMSDEDFELYIKECEKMYKDKGFDGYTDGRCPLLVAEDLVRKARRTLIDVAEPFTGLSFDRLISGGIKNLDSLTDLTCRLIVPRMTQKELAV